jgi:hypothetical protein
MGIEFDREGKVVLDSNGKPKLVRMVKSSPSPFIRTLLEVEVNGKDGILFIDEINRAAAALQSAALTLIQDGDAGDTKISPKIWRVAAMNFADVGVNNFAKAVSNRFCHIWHEADVEAFTKGFITDFMEVDKPVVNSDEEAEKAWLKYKTLITRFVSEQPTYLSKAPEMVEGENDFAFPTPRSWEMTAKILSKLDKNDHDYVSTLVSGCIGKDASKLFLRFIEENKDEIVDLTLYLGKEETFILPNPDRPDEVFQILQNLEYWFTKEPVKWFPMWKRIIRLLHNENHKYGKYTNYDNFIMIYWTNNFLTVLSKVFTGDEKKRREASKALREELDHVYEVMTVSAT